MKIDLHTKEFIRAHADDDPNRLLLSAARYPDIDVPFAVDQIVARRHVREKLPEWVARETLFPSRISAEQCSSESTARYKQQLMRSGLRVCDLTGGLGVDSYYLSQRAEKLYYVERFPFYCEVARYNFDLLGATNIEVIEGDGMANYASLQEIDLFYIDPARRGTGNSRVFALADCEPDLTQALPKLLSHAPRVIAKLSPMADLRQTLELLPGTEEIHVLSVKNDCKELLFVIGRQSSVHSPEVHAVNFTSPEEYDRFHFPLDEEKDCPAKQADTIGQYLYEPNASILKAGAFKTVAKRYGVEKLAVNSHLYTSSELVPGFPGRSFEVQAVYPFNKQASRALSKTIPQAHITVRNFPLSVKELRARLRIQEGGDIYLFATLLANSEKVIIACRKVG
ncbi:class I SAM-dependent methyltransferase [Parabacteroides sp. OttesenSCG-928-J18]|nr:class I SAM-dependent methyltransferase [Parabacteroides sp. OttesenSCG-928-J18]